MRIDTQRVIFEKAIPLKDLIEKRNLTLSAHLECAAVERFMGNAAIRLLTCIDPLAGYK
jgi:hypothetical protein